MKTIKGILQGLLNLGVYKLGWLPQHQIDVIKQREKACSDCPLRNGNWCSKRKIVQVRTGDKVMTPFGFYTDEYKVVRGCGCFLPLKKFSGSECPQNFWLKF